MKIGLIVLQSMDGYIAKDEGDDLSWGSSDDKVFFKKISTEYGTIVVGRKTFETLPTAIFKTRKAIVLTRSKKENNNLQNVYFTNGEPKEIIEFAKKLGIENLLIAGGAEVYSQFLSSGLVNEIYITIAPILHGGGTKAFGNINLSLEDYTLANFFKIGEKEIFIQYQRIND